MNLALSKEKAIALAEADMNANNGVPINAPYKLFQEGEHYKVQMQMKMEDGKPTYYEYRIIRPERYLDHGVIPGLTNS